MARRRSAQIKLAEFFVRIAGPDCEQARQLVVDAGGQIRVDDFDTAVRSLLTS
jgi:hypothetical protein